MKHPLRSSIVAAALVAQATVAAASPADPSALSLENAIEMALQNNETLAIEREGAAAAKAAIDGAQGAYDQYLEIEGSWQRSKDPAASLPIGTSSWIVPDFRTRGLSFGVRQLLPTGGALALRAQGARQTTQGPTFTSFSPSYGTQVGVELRQPLLRDLPIDAARFSVRSAVADRHGAQASLLRAMNETIAAVEQAYWSLAAARLAVQVREEAVSLANEQLEQTRQRTESGDAPRTELAQPRAELERRRGELLEGRETAARADNTLKRLILAQDDPAWAGSIACIDSVRTEITPVDVEASLQKSMASRPELALAGATLERRRVETSFARNAVRPSLDAVASYDRFGTAGSGLGAAAFDGGLDQSFQSLRDNEFNAARLAVVLGLPLRNATARANAAAAGHVERQAEAQLAGVRKAIRAEVLDAAAALESAAQRIEAARSGREAAEIQLAAEKDRYETGLSTNFLVLTRQNDLSRARLDEISALTHYRQARTEMARADGTLIETRGIPVDHRSK
jgi:outer membrane protein TolC